jgi:hypothetical protein
MLLQGVIPHLLSLESAKKSMLKALKENNVSKVRERPCLEIFAQYSTLCSFPSFLYLLFVQNIQHCQSDRVVITGEFIQALSEFSYFETVS